VSLNLHQPMHQPPSVFCCSLRHVVFSSLGGSAVRSVDDSEQPQLVTSRKWSLPNLECIPKSSKSKSGAPSPCKNHIVVLEDHNEFHDCMSLELCAARCQKIEEAGGASVACFCFVRGRQLSSLVRPTNTDGPVDSHKPRKWEISSECQAGG